MGLYCSFIHNKSSFVSQRNMCVVHSINWRSMHKNWRNAQFQKLELLYPWKKNSSPHILFPTWNVFRTFICMWMWVCVYAWVSVCGGRWEGGKEVFTYHTCEDQWPASLPKTVNFGFKKRLCLKGIRWIVTKDITDVLLWPPFGVPT